MFTNLRIDSWQVLVLYIVTILVVAFLMGMRNKRVKFSYRVLTALGLGLVVGTLFGEDATIIRPIGSLYVRLIMMIVIPLVFTSIIKSFTDLKDSSKVKSIGGWSVFWLLFTTALATIIGLIYATSFNLGLDFDTSSISYTPREVVPFEEVILNLFPNNIVSHMAENQMVPVIIFALFISIAMIVERKKHPDLVEPFKNFIDSFQLIMVRLTKFVMRFTPYGVFALIANAAGRNNIDTMKALGLYIIIHYVALITHFLIVHLPLITFVARLNPIRFIKKIYPASIVGFTSQSSYGTLPVTIRSLTDRVGVSERIASFTSPLGANVGMNACGGIFPAMVAVITANAFGLDLAVSDYFLIVLTTTIASIGIAGVPGIASIAASVVLLSLGLPLEGIGLIIGVDALIDMGRTSLNVTGTMVSATLVANHEDELNRDIFNEDQPLFNSSIE